MEIEGVEQCLNEFRVAFIEAKQGIMEKHERENDSEVYEEKKRSAKLTEEMNEIWITAARIVKKHLSDITQTLKKCRGDNLKVKCAPEKKSEGELWMNVCLHNISKDLLPEVDPMQIVPFLDTATTSYLQRLRKISWYMDCFLCGSGKRDMRLNKIVINMHKSSGFLIIDHHWNDHKYSYSTRPDDKIYKVNNSHQTIQSSYNGEELGKPRRVLLRTIS